MELKGKKKEKKKSGRYVLESGIFNEVSLSGICEMSVSYTVEF